MSALSSNTVPPLSPADRQLASGVWHPHLIIIQNLYNPKYSPSFKFFIVLDVFAKKCMLSFSRYDVNRLLCNLFSVNKQASANCPTN